MSTPEGGLTNNESNLLELESWNHRWTNELHQKGVSDRASLSSDLLGFDDLANLSIRVSNALLQFDNQEATLLRDFFGLYQEEPDELREDEFSWAQIDGEHKGPKIYIDNGVGLDIGDKNSLLHRFFAQMNSLESNLLPLDYPTLLNLADVIRQAIRNPSNLERHDWARMYLTKSKFEIIESILAGMHHRQGRFVRSQLGLSQPSGSNRDDLPGEPEISEDLQHIALRKFLRTLALKLSAPIERPNTQG